MTTASPLFMSSSINTFSCNSIHIRRCYLLPKPPQPIKILCLKCTNFGAVYENWFKTNKWNGRKGFLLRLAMSKGGNLWEEKEKKREKRAVKVRFNQGFGFNGGGGDGRDDGTTARVLGNLALAVGLTYLTMTGQLGWLLDAIVSLWLLAFIVPTVGIAAFLWWAGRDMIQGACPNCGNAFQVFKSSLNDELQLCPFCSQPFSVEGNEFVKEPIKFSSKRTTGFGQTFDDLSPWSRKGKNATTTVVDVEAEVKDAD
ncbi:hypothetical protein Cgig2_018940 [Carnegiea gigantea]|uniref:Uncharacterized protein n=1 Tax=Carnegiea gigantea TaxID=171969 RepID=A0A9Q1GSH7_9CARY|nr:hypothetical protein Cgig2_018940 [Carnegiea gigantea]